MATNAKLMKEINEQFLICKICYEPYKNPKTLTCLHTFCSNCLQKHIDSEQERSSRYSLYGRNVFCPICRKKTEIPTGGIRRLPDNFLVSNLTDVVNRLKTTKVPPCEICHMVRTRSNEACSKCLECSKVLCKSCVKLHMNTKVTQNHSLFDLEGEKDIECKSHSGEIVRFYCEPCDECICVVCTFQEHRDHDICSFSEGSAKYKSSIESLVNQSKERLLELRMRLGMIGKCESALKDTRERIRDLAISYISQVRQTEKQLLQRVDAMFGDDILDFLDNKSWLQENLDNLQNTCNLADIVIKDKGIEILLLKKELQSKLGFLLEPDLPKVPDHLATDIKFVPGFVKLGHLSVTNGDEENGETSLNSKDLISIAQNIPNNRQSGVVFRNCHSQTDLVSMTENSTTMNAGVSVESAAAQTVKIETVSRLTGTDILHTRDKSTEIHRMDPKTRGTMTEVSDSRTVTPPIECISAKTPLKPQATLTTKSVETDLKFLLDDEFSMDDLKLLQRVKTYGFEVRTGPKPTMRTRKVQTDDSPPTPPTTPKSVTINTKPTNAPLPLPMPIMRTNSKELKSGSNSPVVDRRARRLSGDIVAIRQRFGDTKPLKKQESLKEYPSPDSPNGSESPPNSAGPNSPLSTNGASASVQNGPVVLRPKQISAKHVHVQTSPIQVVSSCTGPDKESFRNSTTITDLIHLQDAVTDTESLTATKPVLFNESQVQCDLNETHRQLTTHRGSSPVFSFDPSCFAGAKRPSLLGASEKALVGLTDASTETETPQTRDSETSTPVLTTVESWTLTYQTEFVNSGTSPVMTPTREVGISTLNPVLVHQGMSTLRVECVDSETETCLFMQDNETSTDRVQSSDAQTNIEVHRQDGITWVDCSDTLEPGARSEVAIGTSTDEGDPSEDEGQKEGGDSEEDVFFELPDDDDDNSSPPTTSLTTRGSQPQTQKTHQQQQQQQQKQQQQKQKKQQKQQKQSEANEHETMTLPDAFERHNTAVCNMCSLQKPTQIHRSTMSSPTPTQDQGTMVLSFSSSSMEFIDRSAQTTDALTVDKAIEAVFSEPSLNCSGGGSGQALISSDYNDVATSTESLPYIGLLSEVDLDDLYLMPDSAFGLHSDTDTANSEGESDIEMVDQETWMEDCRNVEVGTRTASFVDINPLHPEQALPQIITPEMLDDGSKDLVSIGVNTMLKVTYEKETSTQSRYLYSKGTMTFYLNKSDKSTSTLSGSNRSSIVSRHSLVVDRCDKHTMTSGCGVMDKAVSTDFTHLNEQVANCISKLKNVHDRLQSPTSKQAPETELSPKARKNKPQIEELLGAPTNPLTPTTNIMTKSVPPMAYSLTSSAPLPVTTASGSINMFIDDRMMRPVSAFDGVYPSVADGQSTPSNTFVMSTASPAFMTTTSMSQSMSVLQPHMMTGELRPARDRVTVRKAQPITTLKCRYKDMNLAKSQSLPRQFMSPTSDPVYQQQQQMQQQLQQQMQQQQMQQQQACIRLGSQVASPPSRLPLLRYNSAPGRIVTVPKQTTPKDLTVPSAQTSPSTNTKIPKTRKPGETQKETMKDYYTITGGKAKNQLPSLPEITENRTPSLCSDSSASSNTSGHSSSASWPASTSATSMLTYTSTPESESFASPASSPSSVSGINSPASPTPLAGDPLLEDPGRDCLSPTSAVSSLVMSVSVPTQEPKESSPQSRKGGFMQRLLSRKPKKDPESSKPQNQQHPSPRLSTHSISSTSSTSSAMSISAPRKSLSPKSPSKTPKAKSMKAPPSPAPSSSSSTSPSPRPFKGRPSSKSSSPDPEIAAQKSAKPKKNHPFVYVRQRIFAIQHDGDEDTGKKSQTRERNQKKGDKKSEKGKGSPSPIANKSPNRKSTPPKDPTQINKKEKTPPRSAIPTPEGQSFADVC